MDDKWGTIRLLKAMYFLSGLTGAVRSRCVDETNEAYLQKHLQPSRADVGQIRHNLLQQRKAFDAVPDWHHRMCDAFRAHIVYSHMGLSRRSLSGEEGDILVYRTFV